MRMVKCRDTGEKMPQNKAFKDPEKGFYYSSKKAWDEINRQNKYRNKCYDFFKSLLDISEEQSVPRAFLKKISEYSSYGYDVLYETLLRNKDSMIWALTHKSFQNDWTLASYLFAIVSNNIRLVSKEMKQVAFQKERMEKDNGGEDILLDYVQSVQKVTDISKHLEELL